MRPLLTEPKISVISACYNHGKFVNEMLDSVLRQTFRDFEVIIVNDGSTDNTAEVLDRIKLKNVRIIHSSNQGPSAARNLAIKNARAPVIMNLDADDKIAPDLLEKAYDIFCSDPEAGIVYSDAECFGAKSGKYEIGEYSVENMLYDNRIISQAFFKKSDWEKVGGYSSDFIYNLEDWDFWLLLIESGGKVYKIPESLVYYRIYRNPYKSRSGRMKKDRMKTYESLLLIFHRHKALISNYPVAMKRFAEIEEKLNGEYFLLRLLKNLYFRYLRKI